MHLTEGWLLLLVSLGSLAVVAILASSIERRVNREPRAAPIDA